MTTDRRKASGLNIATIPASQPFLDCVAEQWLARVGVDADAEGRSGGDNGTILVPGRRVARALMEAFLRVLDGRPALLPAIVALGDVEQQSFLPMALDEALPPAVGPVFRLAMLSRLILAAPFFTTVSGRDGGTIDRVWPLAQALAELMDEAERNGVDLHKTLPNAVAEDFADHWQKTLEFLRIVTEAWPAILKEEGRSNIMARQVALIEAQARLWADAAPDYPVWAVGFVDGSAGVATVLEAVAALPEGMVVFQGLDCQMEEALWEGLPPTHPQALFQEFLAHVGVRRGDVAQWAAPLRPARENLFAHVMLPEAGIARWGQPAGDVRPGGISLLPAADSQQEAQAIALILRDVASQPGRSGALVTPDRGLADRVRAELLRFGIHADDSAGEPLVRTPTAVFLRLIAQAVIGRFSPVALLCVLKHPLAALGMSPGRARASARLLERRLLRGPAPQPGLEGLGRALEVLKDSEHNDNGYQADAPDSPESLEGFLKLLQNAFAPMLKLGKTAPVPALLAALLEVAENLAAVAEEGDGPDQPRPGSRLWLGEDGAALSRHFVELMSHTGDLPAQPLRALEGLFTTSMAGKTLTGLRGYQGGVELAHPRISIYGVLEARLLSFDTVILGGLNEGVWPPAAESGPWMSRPMRQRVGLPSPERRIGAQAHDFVSAALSSRQVILSHAQRREGSPSVPARWLMRLSAFLEGQGHKERDMRHPALAWQVALDMPAGEAVPVSPPEPCPPLALRPRRLSVTQIDTLKLDPYAIYARYVLGLKALSPLEEGAEHADYGKIVHLALERMLAEHPETWPANAAKILHGHFDTVLDEALVNPALASWWRPRLYRIADWVLEKESWRMVGRVPSRTRTEAVLGYTLEGLPGGPFRITGRADRIDLRTEPGQEPVASILDYKTGSPPSSTDVVAGWSSQLVLEAVLLGRGAFEKLKAAEVESLSYWYLTGGEVPGKETKIPSSKAKVKLPELLAPVLEQLRSLLADYDDPAQPYRSQPWAGREVRYSDYAQLARVAEWRLAGGDEE